jgi:hypothetical protein
MPRLSPVLTADFMPLCWADIADLSAPPRISGTLILPILALSGSALHHGGFIVFGNTEV